MDATVLRSSPHHQASSSSPYGSLATGETLGQVIRSSQHRNLSTKKRNRSGGLNCSNRMDGKVPPRSDYIGNNSDEFDEWSACDRSPELDPRFKESLELIDNRNHRRTPAATVVDTSTQTHFTHRVLLFCLLFIVVCSFARVLLRSDSPNYTLFTLANLKSLNIQTLKLEFPNQIDRTWRIISASARLLKTGEHHSATILVAGPDPKTNSEFAKAISAHFARNDEPTSNIIIDFKRLNDQSKLSIDQKLETVASKQQIIILENIDKLSDPVLLYRYCDPYTPLFANRIYIMTLNINLDPDRTTNGEQQLAVESFLSSKWVKVPKDEEMVLPLFSRIANSLVIVRPQ